MPPNPPEPEAGEAGHPAVRQRLASQQPRQWSSHTHLKRSPAPLSVRLRPKSSKRVKRWSKAGNEAEVQPLTTHPHSVADRIWSRSRISLSEKPNPYESTRKARAEKWFNDNNQHVSRAQIAAFPDSRSSGSVTVPCGAKILADDPPFYLDRRSSDIDSACAVPSDQSTESRCQPTQRVLPTRSRMDSRESTSEEFRSVIDDLTVKNKKLRQKLKKYEELHCSILQEDKLFEVRIHSLPTHKKCELEQTLRSFASGLRESPDLETLDTAPPQTSLVPEPLPLGKKSSSPWTASKRVDSAYASISATGQTMISQSTRNDAKSITNEVRSADVRRQNCNSDRHDVPQGMLPKKVSKKAKRKIVVRRLEELFLGKAASTGGSHQSLQQQEVSQSANSEAEGRRVETKGVREARILPPGVDFLSDLANDEQTMSQPQDRHPGSDLKSRGPPPSGGETPEQRPTNLLDLDVCRAQIPADNIQYIRHLGLTSPMMNSDAASDQLDGWVYLNILTSMAQLHDLNVTTEFVRKSVADLSSIFELSTDGRKIRWKGSIEATRMSSDGDSSAGEDQSGRRRRRVHGHERSDVNDVSQLSNCNSSIESGAGKMRRPISLGHFKNASNLHYQPLFFRGTKSEDEDYSVCDDDSLTSHDVPDDMTGADSNSRGPRGSKSRSNLFRPQRENGPIIFYNKAKFCTDLSGDASGTRIDDISFSRYTDDPIGRDMLNSLDRMSLDGPEDRLIGSKRTGSAKAKSSVSSIVGSLIMEQPEPCQSDHICKATEPMYLEASGLGGVQPRDNFVVDVQVQYGQKCRDHQHLSPTRGHATRHKIDSLRCPDLRTSAKSAESLVEAKIISSRVTVLPPSTLPDPSYLCLPFSSDNEDDDEDDSNTTSEDEARKPSLLSSVEEQPADEDGRGFILESSSDEASQESSFVRTSEGSDDSSLDFLAHARVLDPDTVAAREAEFESNVGQPLAELPAGSSAATAGGGSGFPSDCSSSSLTMEESRPRTKKRRMQADVASTKEASSSENESL
ncbi:hypothetical protein MMC07_009515 [Pseudocyphellaria aurata]|nr:hypothetical protein [Pseudocyphellaria aurata]